MEASAVQGQAIHGLGGNDIIYGSLYDDWISGGAGDDSLFGNGGSETFDYSFSDAGNDTIDSFVTGSGGDIIRLSDLFSGYVPGTSVVSEFVTMASNGSGGTLITIDHDGTGSDTTLVTINLSTVSYSGTLMDEMLNNGNLVLA